MGESLETEVAALATQGLLDTQKYPGRTHAERFDRVIQAINELKDTNRQQRNDLLRFYAWHLNPNNVPQYAELWEVPLKEFKASVSRVIDEPEMEGKLNQLLEKLSPSKKKK